jgi:hypothetical protein
MAIDFVLDNLRRSSPAPAEDSPIEPFYSSYISADSASGSGSPGRGNGGSPDDDGSGSSAEVDNLLRVRRVFDRQSGIFHTLYKIAAVLSRWQPDITAQAILSSVTASLRRCCGGGGYTGTNTDTNTDRDRRRGGGAPLGLAEMKPIYRSLAHVVYQVPPRCCGLRAVVNAHNSLSSLLFFFILELRASPEVLPAGLPRHRHRLL